MAKAFTDGEDTVVHYDDIQAETDKAYLFVIEGEEVWLPKSQVDVDKQDRVVALPNWLADKKGLLG